MKICKYCGSQNDDRAQKCESCGSTDFKHVCVNCGNEFDEGLFCPRCGIKVGQKPKVCNKCGNTYYSNACPNCGSMNQPTTPNQQVRYVQVQNQKPKRKTWLWVLGWIFIFPVPLTILLVRNKTMKIGLKIGLIAAAWIVYLLIGTSGSDSSTETKQTTQVSVQNVESYEDKDNVAETSEDTAVSADLQEQATDSDTSDSDNAYAADEVVNRFITDFNKKFDYSFTDIRKGNIRTKYFAYANGCYIELLNANDAAAEQFVIKINFDGVTQDQIFTVFKDSLTLLGVSESDINRTIDDLTVNNEGDYMKEDYAINDSISCTYVPTKELSSGTVIGRIDINASNYGK